MIHKSRIGNKKYVESVMTSKKNSESKKTYKNTKPYRYKYYNFNYISVNYVEIPEETSRGEMAGLTTFGFKSASVKANCSSVQMCSTLAAPSTPTPTNPPSFSSH